MDNQLATYHQVIKTKEDKSRAINDLQALRAHPGWILLTQIWNIDIKYCEDRILDTEDMNPVDERELKIHRNDIIASRDMPEIIVTDLMNEGRVEEHNSLDPYDKQVA